MQFWNCDAHLRDNPPFTSTSKSMGAVLEWTFTKKAGLVKFGIATHLKHVTTGTHIKHVAIGVHANMSSLHNWRGWFLCCSHLCDFPKAKGENRQNPMVSSMALRIVIRALAGFLCCPLSRQLVRSLVCLCICGCRIRVCIEGTLPPFHSLRFGSHPLTKTLPFHGGMTNEPRSQVLAEFVGNR